MSDFELLAEARRDRPSPLRRAAARKAVLASAGVVAGVTAITAAKTAVAGTGTAKLATGAFKAGLATKIALTAAVAVGTTTAASYYVLHAPTETAVVISAAPSPPSPGATVAVAPAPDLHPRVEPTPRAIATPMPAPSAKRADTTPVDPLADQARILSEARSCFRKGQYACVDERLAHFEERYPDGALAEEAAVLRMDRARAMGDQSTLCRAAAELARKPGMWRSTARDALRNDCNARKEKGDL